MSTKQMPHEFEDTDGAFVKSSQDYTNERGLHAYYSKVDDEGEVVMRNVIVYYTEWAGEDSGQ